MAIQKLTIEDFVAVANTGIVIDVRSPDEFAHAHIPNAVFSFCFLGCASSWAALIWICLIFFGTKM